jgi:hypothetical protein
MQKPSRRASESEDAYMNRTNPSFNSTKSKS